MKQMTKEESERVLKLVDEITKITTGVSIFEQVDRFAKQCQLGDLPLDVQKLIYDTLTTSIQGAMQAQSEEMERVLKSPEFVAKMTEIVKAQAGK